VQQDLLHRRGSARHAAFLVRLELHFDPGREGRGAGGVERVAHELGEDQRVDGRARGGD